MKFKGSAIDRSLSFKKLDEQMEKNRRQEQLPQLKNSLTQKSPLLQVKGEQQNRN